MSKPSIDNARMQIQKADEKIAQVIKKYRPLRHGLNLNAPIEIVNHLSENIRHSLGDCPVEFLEAITKNAYIPANRPHQIEGDLVNLASALSQRFDAIIEAAEFKKGQGIRSAYDRNVHERVLNSNVSRVKFLGGYGGVASKAFKDVMDLSVSTQDAYLQQNSGPIKQAIQRRLTAA